MINYFDLGFNTNTKNGRVKALSKACLDRTYFGSTIIEEPKPRCVKALSEACLYHLDYENNLSKCFFLRYNERI